MASAALHIFFNARSAIRILIRLLAAWERPKKVIHSSRKAARERPKEAAPQAKAVVAAISQGLLLALLRLRLLLLLVLHVAEVVEIVTIAEALTVERERAALVDGNLQIFLLLTTLQETKRASWRLTGSFVLFTMILTIS